MESKELREIIFTFQFIIKRKMILFEETMVLYVNNKILNGSFEYKYMEKFNKITISNTYKLEYK